MMAAAVADFRPVRPSATKLRRTRGMTLRLEATPDIIARLPRRRGQVVAGCALEPRDVVAGGLRKLRHKRLDVLLVQQAPRHGGSGGPSGQRAPFGRHPVRAWLLVRGGPPRALGVVSKPRAARALLDKAEALWYGQHRLDD